MFLIVLLIPLSSTPPQKRPSQPSLTLGTARRWRRRRCRRLLDRVPIVFGQVGVAAQRPRQLGTQGGELPGEGGM